MGVGIRPFPVVRARNAGRPFTIQSVSKPFVYALAISELGLDEVHRHVGFEPTGEPFDAISPEPETDWPGNSLINAGVVVTSALIDGTTGCMPVLSRWGGATGAATRFQVVGHRVPPLSGQPSGPGEFHDVAGCRHCRNLESGFLQAQQRSLARRRTESSSGSVDSRWCRASHRLPRRAVLCRSSVRTSTSWMVTDSVAAVVVATTPVPAADSTSRLSVLRICPTTGLTPGSAGRRSSLQRPGRRPEAGVDDKGHELLRVLDRRPTPFATRAENARACSGDNTRPNASSCFTTAQSLR